MSRPQPIEYADASAQVRAVFDDIKRSRNVEDVNNFWKYLAHDPATLERTWTSVKEIMSPGTLSPLVKEMLYVAVSVTNGCGYCIASHAAAARKAGMTEAMFGELMAVVGMANETNRLANGYRVPVDAAFDRLQGRALAVGSPSRPGVLAGGSGPNSTKRLRSNTAQTF
jgi:AhpD family alkylhydroperoxidase